MPRPGIPPLLLALVLGIANAAGAGEQVGHGGPVTSIAKQGPWIISGGFDGRVLAWNDDLSQSKNLIELAAPIDIVALLPRPRGQDPVVAASAGEEAATYVDGRTERQRDQWGGIVTAADIDPNEFSCIGYADGSVTCILDEDGRQTVFKLPPAGLPVRQIAALQGGQDLAAVVQHGAKAPVMFRTNDGDAFGELVKSWHVPDDDLATMSLAALGGGRFLRGGSSGDLDLLSLADGLISSAHAHDAPVVVIAADGGRVATGGANGTVTLWTLEDLRLRPEAVIAQYRFPILAMVLDPGGERVIVGRPDGTLEAVPFDARAGAAGPAKPPVLFAGRPKAADRGAKLFNACIACHGLGRDRENKLGPPFGGLFGRRAGVIEDYPYSQTLKDADLIWNDETLSALFENGPSAYLPGTTMPLQMMPKLDDRRALIAHMKKVIEP